MAQLEAVFKQNAGQQDYTPAAAKTAGEIVELPDGRAGVVKSNLAASEKGAVYTSGIFDVKCATGTTFTEGVPVVWDASASAAVAAGSEAAGDLVIGTCVATKTTELVVRVDLNAGEGAAVGAQRGIWSSRVQTIAHDSGTTEFDLVDAADNPNGLILVSALAEISEAMVGTTEDQQIITVYDGDDNSLGTLTATDGAADAIGDVVIGSLSLFAAATGAVLPQAAAGKRIYAKTTQATAGGSIAGEMKVRVLVAPLI